MDTFAMGALTYFIGRSAAQNQAEKKVELQEGRGEESQIKKEHTRTPTVAVTAVNRAGRRSPFKRSSIIRRDRFPFKRSSNVRW